MAGRVEFPDTTNPLGATYLNRLSDLLFILAGVANSGEDVLWAPGPPTEAGRPYGCRRQDFRHLCRRALWGSGGTMSDILFTGFPGFLGSALLPLVLARRPGQQSRVWFRSTSGIRRGTDSMNSRSSILTSRVASTS